jgi:hypothetical protein
MFGPGLLAHLKARQSLDGEKSQDSKVSRGAPHRMPVNIRLARVVTGMSRVSKEVMTLFP